VLALLLVLGLVVFGALWLTVPPDNQTLRIPGLSAPVEITLDGNGVPRIRAANERDAATALGFIHARDRMFQMELMRRAASGRLSELIGSATLPIDKQMRVFGLGRLAEADVAAQAPETRALLEAYAAGVNAWITSRGRFAAMEFLLFGSPEPWRPADSLLWGRTMGLWLSSNYRNELTRQALRDKVPPKVLEQLWPAPPPSLPPEANLTPAGQPDVQPAAATADVQLAAATADVQPAAATARAILAAIPSFPGPFTLPSSASNAWAVDGRRSDTGAPLLAGDPHLSFDFPSLWYLVRIDTPGHVLAGATGPGVPFLILGRNEQIAWTFTTTGADTQDVYIEPANATFTTREERIKVRGAPDTVLTVRETRHGPVISDLNSGDGPILAVAMTNLLPGDTGATGLWALNHARTVEDAGKTAPLISSPVQNLMVADREKIGLFVTGRVPIRRNGDGWAPVPGVTAAGASQAGGSQTAAPEPGAVRQSTPVQTDDAYGWSGFAAGNDLPHVIAPASGRLVNANEPVAPPDFPVFMGRDTFRDWRARRIRALLDSTPKLSTSDFAAMQTDVISTYAVALLPTLRVVPGAPRVLGDWDGAMTENAAQPLIFAAWMNAFHHAVLARSGLSVGASSPAFEFLPFVLSPEGASWCGGDCAPLLKSTFDSTMSSLAERFGPDFNSWRWGAVHQAAFAHPFLRSIPVLGALTTSRIAVPGDGTTLDRGGTDDALEAVHGASYRGVYDLADLDRSLFIMTPGQSGNLLSRHARDFLTRWRDGAMVLLTSKPVEVAGVVRLEP
jgi:penicillin amidase